MQRRNFVKALTAGALVPSVLAPMDSRAEGNFENKAKPKKVLMKVGCQSGGTTEENLQLKGRCGVYNIDGGSPKFIPGVGWDLEDSFRKRDACEKYGISLDAYHWALTSAGIDKVSVPNVMLGKSPERDREIDMLNQMIMVAGKTGVKVMNYNTTILPVLRITYLLDRTLPVAKEYNVKLANHIADPPTPAGYRGITRWNSPDVFAGIKRFAQLYDSKYHGFNFCIGSIAEGLKDPKNDIIPIIRWAGERNQIFNVHLRNIKGGWNNFQEVYPDNGDMNFLQVVRELREVGFDGMVMPDHVPHHQAVTEEAAV